MPRRSAALDPAEAFEGFATRLVRAQELPNIYRYEPLPEQSLFHQSQKKNRILFGGNRGGKTFGGIADDVLVLTRRHPYREAMYADRPRRIRFIGVDFDRGIDEAALPLFSQLLPPSLLRNGSWEDSFHKAKHMLTLEDGSTCSFMSYEQDPNKFQAVSLDHVHFDEEPPKAIFDESVLRVLDTGGTWTMSETPVKQLEWVEEELMLPAEDGRRTDIDIFRLDSRKNKHLPQDELTELMGGMTEEQIQIRVMGEYTGSNKVFPNFTRRYPNVVPRAAFNPRPDIDQWRFARSMDYGFANPTAWLWHAAHRDGTIVTFECLYQAGVVIDTWAQRVLAMDRKIGLEFFDDPDWHPPISVGDPSISHRNGGQTGITNQQAYARAGVPIRTEGIVKQRTGNQNTGLQKMATYLKPRGARRSRLTLAMDEPWWQITENCSALIDEMIKARRPKQTATNAAEKNTSEDIRDKDNHAIDAVKYYFMSTHELRPAAAVHEERSGALQEAMAEAGGFTPVPPTNHAEAMRASVTPTRWARHADPSTYLDLEG